MVLVASLSIGAHTAVSGMIISRGIVGKCDYAEVFHDQAISGPAFVPLAIGY